MICMKLFVIGLGEGTIFIQNDNFLGRGCLIYVDYNDRSHGSMEWMKTDLIKWVIECTKNGIQFHQIVW